MNVKIMKKLPILHPFLFAVFPVLSIFSWNIEETSVSEILAPTGIILILVLGLILFLRGALKNREKVGILISLLLVFFFSFGHIWDLVYEISDSSIILHRSLLFIWSVLFVYLSYSTLKTKRDLGDLTNFLNIAAIFLIIVPLINIGSYYEFGNRDNWQNIRRRGNIEIKTSDFKRSEKPRSLPDIYYIILDRYPNETTLREVYDFDNGEFLNYLSDTGFYVASKSNSNYLKTAHSLASSLNMEYINYLQEKVGEKSRDWRPVYKMLEDYKVWRFLRLKGYKFIHFGSWWNPTMRNKYADANFNLYSLPEFSACLYQTTLLYHLGLELGSVEEYRKSQWRNILYEFDKLAEIPNIKEPTFVFAHILIPHPPYVFDKNGNFLSYQEANNRTEKANYLNQLIFTNKKVKSLVNTLLLNSENPPIIILQSDEGPFPARYERHERSFNWTQATDAELKMKMGILNAYYLPDIDEKVLYPSITPVNSFRLIFNLYFNTSFELLPDKNYAFEDYNHLYKFFDVTDRIKND